MNLHHGRWRITRNGKQGFVLHHRDGEQIPLPQRPALRYLFRASTRRRNGSAGA
jgi:hypothetical protein